MEYYLNGKANLEDYIQFNEIQLKQTYELLRILKYVGLFSLIFSAALSFFILKNIKIFTTLIIFLIVYIILYILLKPLMNLLFKIEYNKNKHLQQNIKINEKNISIITEIDNINITKENIKNIIYDQDSFYIFTKLNKRYIFKKRFLENENNFEEIINFIKINYGKE